MFFRRRALQSRSDASEQSLDVERFAQVANDALTQSPSSRAVIGVTRDQNRWYVIARSHQVAMQLSPSHARHVDIGDQTGGMADVGRRQKIYCGREGLSRESHCLHEIRYTLTKVHMPRMTGTELHSHL